MGQDGVGYSVGLGIPDAVAGLWGHRNDMTVKGDSSLHADLFAGPAAGVGQLRRAMIWQRTEDSARLVIPFKAGSARWQIATELNPGADDILIDKIAMSAFTGTFLDIALRDARIDSFIIAGIALEVGIEPTVRHGSDLNYIPIVVTDACGSRTQELKEGSLHSLETTGEVIFGTTTQITSLMNLGGKK